MSGIVLEFRRDGAPAERSVAERMLGRLEHRGRDGCRLVINGQMALGWVSIYDQAKYWADADVQISTKNIVRPHAYVGGITSTDKAHVIRIGRGWDGYSGSQGDWDQPDGCHGDEAAPCH